MLRRLGEIGFVQGFQYLLELSPALGKAGQEGSRATVEEFLGLGLARRAKTLNGRHPPGELRRTTLPRVNHLGVKRSAGGQMRHGIRRAPAGTIGGTLPERCRPLAPRL